jgi:hypothetical protein
VIRLIKAFIIIFIVALAFLAALGVRMFLGHSERASPGPSAFKEFALDSMDSVKEWEEKNLARNNTVYTAAEAGGAKCIKATADDACSALFYKKDRMDFKERPFVSWDWMAESFPVRKSSEALDKRSEFDFAAQFYVIFYSRFVLKTRAIQYVWAQTLADGTKSDSPFTPNVKVMVIESGKSDVWKHEQRDIAADYSTLFGEPLDRDVAAVAFMTDSDSNHTVAAAYYKDVKIGYLGADKQAVTDKGKGIKARVKRFVKGLFVKL